VPTNPLTMIQQFRAYFAANPGRETPNVQGVACTAAACEIMAKGITDAETAVNQAEMDSGTAYDNFQAGLNAGRARLSGLRVELDQLMTDDDLRWYAFGFNRPSDPSSPEIPGNLTVSVGAPGSAMLNASWDAAPRATSYRLSVALKSDGTEVASKIVKDCQFSLLLDGTTTGTVLDVTVTGRNGAGESSPCNAVEATMP
jgi:hypothetical protein